MNFVLFKDAVIYLTNQIDLDKKPVFRDLTHIGLKQMVFSAFLKKFMSYSFFF